MAKTVCGLDKLEELEAHLSGQGFRLSKPKGEYEVIKAYKEGIEKPAMFFKNGAGMITTYGFGVEASQGFGQEQTFQGEIPF